jgi:hypothetical protein
MRSDFRQMLRDQEAKTNDAMAVTTTNNVPWRTWKTGDTHSSAGVKRQHSPDPPFRGGFHFHVFAPGLTALACTNIRIRRRFIRFGWIGESRPVQSLIWF